MKSVDELMREIAVKEKELAALDDLLIEALKRQAANLDGKA